MTKNISLTIDEDLLNYLDELAEINGRSRSGMISWFILNSKRADEDLDREAKNKIQINSDGDTSNFNISGNAEEIAREYAALTLALKDKHYHIYDYALWLIQNEEKKGEGHKGIIFEEVDNGS